MRDSIFVTHEHLMDLAQRVCQECHWYGHSNELDHQACPECESEVRWIEDNNSYGGKLGQDDLDSMCVELLEQTMIFNRAHGHMSYRSNRPTPVTNNALFEIDMHGTLEFRVLNWHAFRQENSKGVDYYKIDVAIDMEIPAEVDYTTVRDLLWSFELLWRELDNG